jgi:hypothetical protein
VYAFQIRCLNALFSPSTSFDSLANQFRVLVGAPLYCAFNGFHAPR